jgi:DNA processing protein
MAAVTDTEILACLRLYGIRGIGPYTANQLLASFGSAAAFWQAGATAWQAQEGIGPKLLQALQQSSEEETEQLLQQCRSQRIRLLVRDDPQYPESLRQIDDAPLVLFAFGNLDVLQASRMLAIVGARKASKEGRLICRRWSEYLSSQQVVTVSGMAYGIDAAVHGGAVAVQAPTVAVLGAGLLTLYPMQQQQVRAIVGQGGCVLSEYLPEQSARPEYFPQRNRIIAGLSAATLVMEADVASGSLITARHALRYGREVFAVPGSVLNQNHAGCHQLIRDGAYLAESADDVMQLMGWQSQAARDDSLESTLAHCNDGEQAVIRALQHDVLHVDQLAEACACTVPDLAALLLSLEMQSIIESLPGSRYTLRRH